MYKRVLALLVFLGIVVFVYFKGEQLPLAFLVLFPFVIFPIFYLCDFQRRRVMIFAGLVALGLLGIAVYKHHSFAMILLGPGVILVLSFLVFYRVRWIKLVEQESALAAQARDNYETLHGKYETRLESLHRLEKQVSSLMELFDIARNFSECLSFESMSKVMREKIMPEMPFERLTFMILDPDQLEMTIHKSFVINRETVKETNSEFSEDEMVAFRQAFDARRMIKKIPTGRTQTEEGVARESWVFPLILDGGAAALMWVEGAQNEDLVRFEVLVAHLILQVKKIRLYETVKALAIIDGLTGVYVRRHFLERFNEEVQRSLKFDLPLAVLMLDIDHFKRYNDEFGHLVGDATLKEVAAILRKSLRKVDVVARYGGEEFIAILPETGGEAAHEVAERIRSNIARHRFKVYDVETKVTVSLGISLYPEDISEEKRKDYYPDLGFDLIRHADKALYRAKEEGRNRIYRYQEL